MKKTILTAIIGISFLALSAQVEVTTKSFDLESQNKHKNWRIGYTRIDSETGNILVNMQQTECDKSVGFTETTFRGTKWNIDKLVFDANFNYLETISSKYKNTAEALLNNEYVFGEKYKIVAHGSASAAIVKAAAATTTPMPNGLIDNSFMFTTIVTGNSTMTGFKLASSHIGLEMQFGVGEKGGGYCTEYPAAIKKASVDAKEEKGQRWIPMFSNPVPNGGNILFNTSGVLKEEKGYWVFRKYDEHMNVLKEQTFTFDYQCIMYGKEIEKAPGVFDYVFVAWPINYKKSKMPTVPANSYQYFYVDGDTYEIKENVTIVTPNSEWTITDVIHDNGSTYIIGGCGLKNNVYTDISVLKPNIKVYENLQVAKITNGKLDYVNSNMNKDLKSTVKTTGGLKPSSKVNFFMTNATLTVSNGKLIYSGKWATTHQAFVIDDKGKIETILSTTEKANSRSRISFSKDGKKMFWLLEDLEVYNKVSKGMIYPKKSRELVSGLSIVSYDLESNKILKYQDLKNEEWALNYYNPILLDNDNTIIMLGSKLTKKAKESEMVFITIKK